MLVNKEVQKREIHPRTAFNVLSRRGCRIHKDHYNYIAKTWGTQTLSELAKALEIPAKNLLWAIDKMYPKRDVIEYQLDDLLKYFELTTSLTKNRNMLINLLSRLNVAYWELYGYMYYLLPIFVDRRIEFSLGDLTKYAKKLGYNRSGYSSPKIKKRLKLVLDPDSVKDLEIPAIYITRVQNLFPTKKMQDLSLPVKKQVRGQKKKARVEQLSQTLKEILEYFGRTLPESEEMDLVKFLLQKKSRYVQGHYLLIYFPWYVFFYLELSCSHAINYRQFRRYLHNSGYPKVKPADCLQIKHDIQEYFGKACSREQLMLKEFKRFYTEHSTLIPPPFQRDIQYIIKGNAWTGSPQICIASVLYYFLKYYRIFNTVGYRLSTDRIAATFLVDGSSIRSRRSEVISIVQSLKGETHFIKLIVEFLNWLIENWRPPPKKGQRLRSTKVRKDRRKTIYPTLSKRLTRLQSIFQSIINNLQRSEKTAEKPIYPSLSERLTRLQSIYESILNKIEL